MDVYRSLEIVEAEKVEKRRKVVTVNGAEYVNPGEYLVRVPNGVQIVSGKYFESRYSLAEESISESRRFTPVGKTVDEVLEFFKEFPDEIERVKDLERNNGARKGILNYTRPPMA